MAKWPIMTRAVRVSASLAQLLPLAEAVPPGERKQTHLDTNTTLSVPRCPWRNGVAQESSVAVIRMSLLHIDFPVM